MRACAGWRTDRIEVFQLHGVNTREKMAAVLSPGGAVEGMMEGVRAGKVRFLAFSSHSLPVAEEVIGTDRFDAVQIPFNFVDREAADRVIPLAAKADMGIIAMKPLGGGLLEDARLCFRYLLQFPEVVPDPGIETLPQLREILDALGSTGPLTGPELEAIERHRARLGSEWCHRCDYCQPCPHHISISTILVAKSFARRMPMERVKSFVEAAFANAESCEHCRECVQRCPYNLEIPDLLEKQRRIWDQYLKTGVWGGAG